MTEEITIQEFDSLCERLLGEYEHIDNKKKELKEIQAEADALEAKVLYHLEQNEKEKYHLSGHTFYIHNRFTVTMPKEMQEKKAVFEYIRNKYGDTSLLNMQSVVSQTLNAWYKQEMDVAIAEGNVDFKIPGIGEPKHYKSLGVRKS